MKYFLLLVLSFEVCAQSYRLNTNINASYTEIQQQLVNLAIVDQVCDQIEKCLTEVDQNNLTIIFSNPIVFSEVRDEGKIQATQTILINDH